MTSEQLAWKIRRHSVEMTHRSGGSHIGSILSVADIVAVLYTDIMSIDASNPEWSGRDRFILSKGHAGASVYAALAEKGFFPLEELTTHYANGSRLSGHVSHHLPGVDFSTGSLGHGLSAAAGMAYAAKKDGEEFKVYTVLGDGECNEGSIWEAVLFANHFRLNNLIAIIDRNQMQSLDFCENTIEMDDMGCKWRSFGWHVIETDGNDHRALKAAFRAIDDYQTVMDHKPSVVIADTIKGYGIPFMQNDILWHYRFPHAGWEYDNAVAALHSIKPVGVIDPYTPDGLIGTIPPIEEAKDMTFTATWRTVYPEKMRRVYSKPGSGERAKKA